ncbi:MAG: MipA/OmpV family protein [Pseudomonadota bacterium]
MIIQNQRTALFKLAGLAFAAALNTPEAQAQAAPQEGWQFTAGGAAFTHPEYPGSGATKTEVLPLLGASYGRYFFGGMPGSGVPVGLGAYLIQDEHWQAGVALGGGFSKLRKESDSPRLRGLGDIDNTVRASIFGAYTMDWLSVHSALSADIGGKNQGLQGSLDVEGKYKLTDELTLSAGPGLGWGDSKYMQTVYGVDAGQSARSGLRQYTAGGGINTVRFSLGADYRLSRNWNLGTRVSAAKLRGDAADSPITEKTSQTTVAVFAGYRW